MAKQEEQDRLQTGLNTAAESADFERAISLTGCGRYHLEVLLVCGLISMSVGFQNGLSSYVLSSAQCDLNLSSSEMGMLNAAFLAGGTASAMLWGVIADGIGRKKILVMSLLVDGIVTLISSFSGSFLIFASLRFINGFVIGAPGTLTFSYIGEFYSDKHRPKAVTMMGFFWVFSWVLLPVFAWIIIPLNLDVRVFGIAYNSWRLFVLVFGLPSLLSALLLMRYPESPRFLLSQGKKKEALVIIRQIFAVNSGKSEHEFPISNLLMDSGGSNNQANTISDLLSNMWNQMCYLFTPPLLKYTVLVSVIMAADLFGYFGFALWLPELFNRFEKYYRDNPDASITLCELSALRQETQTVLVNATESIFKNVSADIASTLTTTSVPILEMNLLKTCDPSVDPKVFINAITMSAVCLVANAITVYVSHRLDRKTLPILTLVVAGICSMMNYFVRSTFQYLIVACLFSSFANVGLIAVTAVVVDIFPTRVNAMAVCAATFSGRFGAILSNILFGSLLDTSCTLLLCLMSAVLLFGGLLGFFIPKNSLELPEEEKEEEKSSTA